jgi:hypothetical protein
MSHHYLSSRLLRYEIDHSSDVAAIDFRSSRMPMVSSTGENDIEYFEVVGCGEYRTSQGPSRLTLKGQPDHHLCSVMELHLRTWMDFKFPYE